MEIDEMRHARESIRLTTLSALSESQIRKRCDAYEEELKKEGYTPAQYAKLAIENKRWFREMEEWFMELEHEHDDEQKLLRLIASFRSKVKGKRPIEEIDVIDEQIRAEAGRINSGRRQEPAQAAA